MRTSRLRQMVIVTAGAVMASLPAADASAWPGPTAATAPHVPLHGSAECPDADMAFRPRSEFPDTAQGKVDYIRQNVRAGRAIFCLVNGARQIQNPPVPALRGVKNVSSPPRGIGGAPIIHARAAVRLRWWGDVDKYVPPTDPNKKCTPRQDDSTRCDPHINPETGSTSASRMREVGYPAGCKSWSHSENTYTGWGVKDATPQAAFNWWMSSDGHRAAILNPEFRETGVWVEGQSADPAATPDAPGATYVQVFGRCDR